MNRQDVGEWKPSPTLAILKALVKKPGLFNLAMSVESVAAPIEPVEIKQDTQNMW